VPTQLGTDRAHVELQPTVGQTLPGSRYPHLAASMTPPVIIMQQIVAESNNLLQFYKTYLKAEQIGRLISQSPRVHDLRGLSTLSLGLRTSPSLCGQEKRGSMKESSRITHVRVSRRSSVAGLIDGQQDLILRSDGVVMFVPNAL
jgi:hypothetical protein